MLIPLFAGVLSLAVPAGTSDMVRAELAFAALAKKEGTRTAFLANLGPDGLVLDPYPALGRDVWERRQEDPGLLTWYPVRAEVSQDGRMGYTTGPWEYRKDRKDPSASPAGRGRFVTVWRKGEDGSWRVAFDGGDSQPCPGEPLTEASPEAPATPQGLTPQREAELLAEDRSALVGPGDLRFILTTRQVKGSTAAEGQVSLRVWRKVREAWRLRILVEKPLP